LKHFLGDANPLKLIEEKNVALKKTQERVDALLEEFNELKVHAKESKAYAQWEQEENVQFQEDITRLKEEFSQKEVSFLYMWINGELRLTHPRASCTINQDFVSQETNDW